jgi:hypothetical protein
MGDAPLFLEELARFGRGRCRSTSASSRAASFVAQRIEVVPTLKRFKNGTTPGNRQPDPTPTIIAAKIQAGRNRSRKESREGFCPFATLLLTELGEPFIRHQLAAPDVSMDELLQPEAPERRRVRPSHKVLRRLELIESLPTHQQQTVLKTIDTMLRGLQRAS